MAVNFIPDATSPSPQSGTPAPTGVDFFPDDATSVAFQPEDPVDVERQNIVVQTLGNIGTSLRRGWLRSQLSDELAKDNQAARPEDRPNPETVVAYQREIRNSMPSPEFMVTMDETRTPAESWAAFSSNPVQVLGEMMGESFSGMAHQLINKGPARIAIGAGMGATTALVAGQAGPQALLPEEVVTVPAGAAIGARAGLAQTQAAGSYTLEMSDGILKSLEEAGFNIGDPEQLKAAFEDKDRMQLAREFAQKKAVPVAAFDLASALIAGRFASKQTASALNRVARGGLETLVQSLFGMGGEATGQVVQSGGITAPRAIAAEGVGQLAASTPEVILATRFRAGERPPVQQPTQVNFTPDEPAATEGFGDVADPPSEPIVTEPPAAPRKIFRGVSPDVDYSSGDQFWSESREVAENYAAQTGTEGTIDEATPDTLPQKLYTTTDKPTLKDELELKSEPFAPEFDAEAKAVLQARGFEGIRYESGTDLGGEQAAEFHVFGKQKPSSGTSTSVDRTGEIPAPTPLPEATEVKPRTFTEKAKESDAILAGAKLKMGSYYGVASDPVVLESARNWVNENGMDAALDRIRRLNETRVLPSAVDGAIAQEAMARASAIGTPAMEQYQADIADYMAEMGTASGQFINTFKFLGMMTPGGVIRYADKQIERQIGTLPPERQREILQQREEVKAIRGELGNLRRAFSSKSVTETQYGGETVQARIARRLGGQKKAEPALVAFRDALSSGLNQTQAQADAAKVLQDAGLSESEAGSISAAATKSFYARMKDARRDLVLNRGSFMAGQQRAVQQLLKEMDAGEMNDADFIGRISQIKGVPALTAKLNNRLKTLAAEYQAADDPEVKIAKAYQINEEIATIMPSDIFSKMQSYVYLSTLLFPLTWMINIMGNTAAWFYNIGRDVILNGTFDPAMRIFSKEKARARDVDAGAVGLSAAGYGAMGAGIGTMIAPGPGTLAGLSIGSVFGAASAISGAGRVKGLLTPIQDIKKGYDFAAKMYPESGVGKRVKSGLSQLRAMSRMTSQNKYTETDVRNATRRMYSNQFGRAFEATLSVGMGAFDRAFYMSQYNASMSSMIAAAKANGEWTGAPTPEMEEAARADAMDAIYQDNNFISRALSQIRKAVNFDKQFGLGTGLLLFTQVVGSIAKKGMININPIGFIQASYRGMRGILFASSGGRYGARFDRQAFNKEFTEALLGTGILLAPGYYLAKLGIVTAGPESDERLEAMRRASGFGKYSINISAFRRVLLSGNWVDPQPTLQGDFIAPYAWAQPVAITFAAGAEMAQIQRAKTLEGIKEGSVADPSVVALAVLTASKSMQDLGLLSGLASFFSSYQYNNKNWLAAMAETALGMPSMFVPQAVRKFAQWQDNTIRETRGRVEYMEKLGVTEPMVQRAFARLAAQTPGLSKKFPPRFDLMGAAQERYQYEGNSFVNLMFNPVHLRRAQQDPVLMEITRLVNATGDTTIIPTEPNSRKIVLNGKPFEMTNDQLAAYKFYLGNYTMSIYRHLASSPEYVKLPDATKIDIFNKFSRDVNAAVKTVVLGNDVNNLTTDQQAMAVMLMNSELAQTSVPQVATPPRQ